MSYPTLTLTDANGLPIIFTCTVAADPATGLQIPYIELYETGPAEDYTQEGQTITRTLACSWTQRQQFRVAMLGTTKYLLGNSVGGASGTSTTTNITRSVPEVHGEFSTLYAQECRLIEAMAVPPANIADLAKIITNPGVPYPATTRDGGTFAGLWALAKFAVTYRDLNYNVYSDTNTPNANGMGELNRYITRMPRPEAEMLAVPQSSSTNGLKRVQVPTDLTHFIEGGQVVPTLSEEFNFLWRQLPFIPDAVLDPQLNKVNNVPFDLDFNGDTRLAAGTVLFRGYTPERRYKTAAGDIVWDITLSFMYKPQGWNFFPQLFGSKNGFTLIGTPADNEFGFYLFTFDGTNTYTTANGNPNTIYGATDLNQLFVFPNTAPPIPP